MVIRKQRVQKKKREMAKRYMTFKTAEKIRTSTMKEQAEHTFIIESLIRSSSAISSNSEKA